MAARRAAVNAVAVAIDGAREGGGGGAPHRSVEGIDLVAIEPSIEIRVDG